jgi:hypothetical protein
MILPGRMSTPLIFMDRLFRFYRLKELGRTSPATRQRP